MVKKDNIGVYFSMLDELKLLCKCNRLQVGCLVLKNNSIISSGINGTPSGYNNSCEEFNFTCRNCNSKNTIDMELVTDAEDRGDGSIVIKCKDKYCDVVHEYTLVDIAKHMSISTKDVVIHAEENAILKAVKNHIPLDGSSMVVSHMPCIKCAKMIYTVGVKEVIYKEDYKNSDGIDFLMEMGVKVIKHKG